MFEEIHGFLLPLFIWGLDFLQFHEPDLDNQTIGNAFNKIGFCLPANSWAWLVEFTNCSLADSSGLSSLMINSIY